MNEMACVLCGHKGPDVRVALVRWRDPEPEPYGAVPRCNDVDACRGRVYADGESWPLIEARRAA